MRQWWGNTGVTSAIPARHVVHPDKSSIECSTPPLERGRVTGSFVLGPARSAATSPRTRTRDSDGRPRVDFEVDAVRYTPIGWVLEGVLTIGAVAAAVELPIVETRIDDEWIVMLARAQVDSQGFGIDTPDRRLHFRLTATASAGPERAGPPESREEAGYDIARRSRA